MFEPRPTAWIARFGPFEANFETGELRKHGIKIKLQEKPFQILELLVTRQGEVVTREALRERLWTGDTFVDFDQSLNTAIKKLRQALGDSAASPRYVATESRRGYRFLVSVETITKASPPPTAAAPVETVETSNAMPEAAATPSPDLPRPSVPRWWLVALTFVLLTAGGWAAWRWRTPASAPAAAGPIRSIAVLPIDNLSRDAEQEYFADGLTDALISRLAQVRALRVTSRTSAMRYKGKHKLLSEIASELHVDAVVEGTVQRSRDQVKITAQLVETATDRSLWAETYQRNMKDILAVQEEIALAVANRVEGHVSAQESTRPLPQPVNTEAYENYLKGRYFWNMRSADGMRKATGYFDRAIALEPGYAQAYSGLADCYNLLSFYGVAEPAEAFPKAREAALKALQLDENSAEAHAALGFVQVHYDWNWSGAQQSFRRSLELNRNYANAHHWYAHYLLAAGRLDESLSEINQALALDPLNLGVSNHIGHQYLMLGKPDRALTHLTKLLEINPNSSRTHYLIGKAYEAAGRPREALAELQKAAQLAPDDLQSIGGLGIAAALRGDQAAASAQLEKLRSLARTRKPALYQIAMIQAAMKQKDASFATLNEAFQHRLEDLIYIKFDPDAASLRGDPRFGDLVRRIGLPD